MRSKKIHFSAIIPMLALGIMFVLAACEDNKDLYNPERVQEEAKKAFPVKNIDPNQTWETSAVCNASVSVNEKDGEIYTIKVYTSNPYNVNSSDVFLLAKTTVANGKTANFKFDIPAALQYIYVMKVNSEGYSSAVPVAVTDGNMNVTFGGESTETRMATTKSTSSIINFTAPDPTNLAIFPTKESVKGYDNYPTDNYWTNKQGNYIVTASYDKIDYQGNGGGVYIQGDVTLTSLYLGSNCKLFILPESSLTLENGEYSLSQSGSMISIGIGATLNVKNGKLQASNATIYNLGTINANAIEAAGSGYIYNNGTLNIDTKVNVANWASLLVNEGTMTATSFETQGSSSFYNSGNVTISEESFLSSTDQKWENQGYFKTGTMKIVATSSKLLTACQLYIDGLFDISTSDSPSNLFSVEGGSYVQCGSLYMDNARVSLGGKAFFNVLGTATYNYNLGGFYSTTGEFALLKINEAIQNQQGQGNTIGYHGKLYVACDHHFENGLSGSVPYIIWDGAEITGADNADIEIPHSQCNPGYKGTADEDKDDDDSDDKYPLLSYAYAFEDMTKEALTDYDFNDVVLYVTTPYKKGGQNVVDVTLKAAGASKQLTVFFKDLYSGTSPVAQNIFGEKGGEVHTVFGVEPGTLINTGIPADTEAKTATKEFVTVTVKVSDGFNITEHGDFYIVDEKGKEVHIPNFTPGFKKGNVPYAIRVASTTWKWAKERVSITEAYKGFEEWAQDAMKEPTWYDSPVSGNVY